MSKKRCTKFVKIDKSTTLANDDRDVKIVGPDVTVTPPPDPKDGQRHFFLADGFDAGIVSDEKHPLECSPIFLENGTCLEIVFSCTTGKWYPEYAPHPCLDSAFLNATDWFINAVSGSDTNSGFTANQALKTWREWQRRVGTFTKLTPTGGTLRIHVRSDLPSTDPITFKNFLGAGVAVLVLGEQDKILTTGTLTQVIAENLFTNQPEVVRGPGITNNLGKQIRLTSGALSGAVAGIARNLGSNRAHVGEWFFVDGQNDSQSPAFASPAVGDRYQVVDYVQVSLAELVGGGDPAKASGPLFLPGVSLHHLHVRAGEFPVNCIGDSIGTSNFNWRWAECIFDCAVTVKIADTNAANCNFLNTGSVVEKGGHLFLWGGLFTPVRSTDENGNFGGFEALSIDGIVVADGRVTNAGNVSQLTTLQSFSDWTVQPGGQVYTGPTSWWDSFHGFNINGHGMWRAMADPGFSPLFGEFGVPQFWGNGNLTPTVIQYNSSLHMTSFNFLPAGPVVPTLQNNERPEGWTFTINAPNEWESFTWKKAPPGPTGHLGPIPNLWGNLLVSPPPAGFRTFTAPPDPGFTYSEANSLNPAIMGTLTYANLQVA